MDLRIWSLVSREPMGTSDITRPCGSMLYAARGEAFGLPTGLEPPHPQEPFEPI
jgi:hypothetical protein